VALSGDGGDEVFGGYPRYLARRWAARFNRLPRPARRAAAALAGLLGERADRYGGGAGGRLRRFAAYAEQLQRRPAATRLEYFPPEAQAALLVPEVFEQVARAGSVESGPSPEGFDPVDWAQRRDLVDYLPDDILVKVDRTSMAASLEARAPLLDHRVVEFMLSLPVNWKLRGRTGKYLLRRLARRLLPAEVLRRKKHGFAIALGEWFRAGGAGRRRLEALAGGALARLVRPEAVRELAARHDSGRRDLGEHLWALLVLGLWAERQPRNPV
jgi:asparagine synthase (glutamine-hydrolysing)